MGKEYIVYNNQLWEPYKSFEYTGELEEFSLTPGTYLFVAHGAKGGDVPGGNPFISFGGTTYGILDLDHNQTFYAAVGGDGENANIGNTNPKGGYNGGGDGGLSANRILKNGAGGGGATDVRLSGEPNGQHEEEVTIPGGYKLVEYIDTAEKAWDLGEDAGDESTWFPGARIQTDYVIKAKSKIEMVFELPYDTQMVQEWYDTMRARYTYTGSAPDCSTTVCLFGSHTAAEFNPDSTSDIEYYKYFHHPGFMVSVGEIKSKCSNVNYIQYSRLSLYCNDCNVFDNRDLDGVPFDPWGVDYWGHRIQDYHITSGQVWHLPFHTKIKCVVEPYEQTVRFYNMNGMLLSELSTPDFEEDMDYPGVYYDGRRVDCYTGGNPMWIGSYGFYDPDKAYQSPEYNTAMAGWLRIYSFKVWEDGELVHDYAPFTPIDSSDIYHSGLYDLVDKRFFFQAPPTTYYVNQGKDFTNSYFRPGPDLSIHDQTHTETYIVKDMPGANSRILVAGGGGGTSVAYETNENMSAIASFGGGASSSRLIGPAAHTSENNILTRATQQTGNKFGIGGDAENKYYCAEATSTNFSVEGQGGGGGGWYGGYAAKGLVDYKEEYSAYGGSGGSSYVLTASSAKPEGYMEGYEAIYPTLYFRNTMMRPYQAFDGAKLVVYKEAEHTPGAGDKVTVPYTGNYQHANFLPGKYKIKCYGGDGGTRYDLSTVAKGGYVESIFNLPEQHDLFFHVGSSALLWSNIGDTTGEAIDTIFGNPAYYLSSTPIYTWQDSGSNRAKGFATGSGGSVDVRLIDEAGTHPEVRYIPDQYNQYEYIESDGTQYFKLGSRPGSSIRLEIICELTDTGAQQCIYGSCSYSSSSGISSALAVFPVYDPADPQTAFLYNKDIVTNGSSIPFNQKIKIVIEMNVLSWYDMSDNLLGSITAPYTSSVSPSQNPAIFDCNRGGTIMGAKAVGKLYSIIGYSRTTGSVGTILGLPYGDPNDDTEQGLWNITTTMTSSSAKSKRIGGNPFTMGPQVEEKDTYTASLNNKTLSINSRIVVAGGGGGMGSPIGLGGAGGGTEGEKWRGTATTPRNNGPGTQTSGYAFGYSNSSSIQSAGVVSYSSGFGYCGSGGSGWYNGYSADRSSYSPQPKGADVNMGGSGGSGYVLTATTHNNRPQSGGDNVPPDAKYYMRDEDVVNIQGGNPVRGMTKIEIDVISVKQNFKILAGDSDGYKTFSNASWKSIEASELTPEVFNEYGIDSLEDVTTDRGLTFPYKLYVYNPDAADLQQIYSCIIPTTKHLTFSEVINETDVSIKTVISDSETDINGDINVSCDISPEGETKQKISFDAEFDLYDNPEIDPMLYMIELKIRKKDKSNYYPEQIPEVHGNIVLCNTRTESDSPTGYKNYSSSFVQATVINSTSTCAYKHNIYIATMIDNSKINLYKYTTAEDKYYTIRENITSTALSETGACGGQLLINDDTAYLINSSAPDGSTDVIILEIPFDSSKSTSIHRSKELSEDAKYNQNVYGQAYWYSSTKILFRTMGGHMTFDVKTYEWEFYDIPAAQLNAPILSFAVGGYSIMEFSTSSSTVSPYLFDPDSLLTIDAPAYQMEEGKKIVCYSEGFFYVAQQGYLYIFEDHISGKPVLKGAFAIPNELIQPKTIICSDKVVYITFEDTTDAYAFNARYNIWSYFTLPFNDTATGTTGWHRPSCFKGYYFIADKKLFVTNAAIQTMYKVGEKLSSIMIATNSHYPNQMTYDPEFFDVTEEGVVFHKGYMSKPLSSFGENILVTADYTAQDYRKIISYSFTLPEEE